MLGDRVIVTIEDVAVLRRAVYARRVPPEKLVRDLESGRKIAGRSPRGRERATPQRSPRSEQRAGGRGRTGNRTRRR
jgi:hypothetical protein